MELGLFRRQRGPLAQSTPAETWAPSLPSGQWGDHRGVRCLPSGWFQPSMASHISQQPWVVS